ncbi:hypothetical protein [Flexithrix dorotheae]|uniref:hypothetical protein n=1 Tax=Flexithrix dorotheae TaxID=70993 RepID=UPI000368BA73|nr:hypothetical protein [Flexithrix dorotheae]
MIKLKYYLVLSIVTLSLSCVPKKEHEKIKSQLDSLQIDKAQQEALLTEMDVKMDSIGVLLDSIEMAEAGILLNLENGIRYDDYVNRLAGIQQYMARTNAELQSMEEALIKSESQNKVYQKVIATYKRTIREKDETIKQLEEKLVNYEEEKTALVKTVDLQNDEIMELEQQVNSQQNDLQKMAVSLDSTQVEAVKAQADKFFSLARSTEALADKTSGMLNGKKKKAYYRQAFDYYKQAFELDEDRTDAFDKMTELEDKF